MTTDAQTTQRWLRRLLYLGLIGLGVLSVPNLDGYGPIRATDFLDAWIILLLFLMVVRGKTTQILPILLVSFYALTRIIPALYIDAPLRDFAQAYRWILYLLVLAFAVGRKWGPVSELMKFAYGIIGLALVKATIGFAFSGFDARTGLLLENNFELALYCGLGAILFPYLGRGKLPMFAMLAALTVLSGSRSGAIAFLVFAVYVVTRERPKGPLQGYAVAVGLPLLAAIPVIVFANRGSGVNGIDRVNFLNVFLQETAHWDIGTWLIGTLPITPLTSGCISLSYYDGLLSSLGDGSCYSVILHAFALRVTFDAGLVGLLGSLIFVIVMMRRGGSTWKLTLCLAAIGFANGLSVSGFNNPYVMLPIVLATMGVGASTIEAPAQPFAGQIDTRRRDRRGTVRA